MCTTPPCPRWLSLQDCWVIVFDRVLDVTPVLRGVAHDLIEPILRYAGDDVSHWFVRRSPDDSAASGGGAGASAVSGDGAVVEVRVVGGGEGCF
jgi:hypothetical protein